MRQFILAFLVSAVAPLVGSSVADGEDSVASVVATPEPKRVTELVTRKRIEVVDAHLTTHLCCRFDDAGNGAMQWIHKDDALPTRFVWPFIIHPETPDLGERMTLFHHDSDQNDEVLFGFRVLGLHQLKRSEGAGSTVALLIVDIDEDGFLKVRLVQSGSNRRRMPLDLDFSSVPAVEK